MSKPFKFHYVNELVGGFVLLVVAALVAAVFVAGQAQRWFEPRYDLHVDLPPEGSFGLQAGAAVDLLGTPVGTVERIVVEDDSSMRADLVVRGDFARFIRADSVAVVKRKFGVAGDAYLEITAGTGAALAWGEAPSIACRRDTEITELLQLLVERVESAVLPALEELTKALEEYRGLAADLRDPGGELRQTMRHVETLTRGLAEGEGAAGRLLRDPALAEEVGKTVGELNAILGRVRAAVEQTESILRDVKTATTELPAAAETVRGEIEDVPGLVLQARATLRETERVLLAAQQHWLLRRYAARERPLPAIEPAAVAAPGEAAP